GHEGDVLVTVGMAYEGLDVPSATHLVCLSDTRSAPWLEQAFARVTRFNPRCGVELERQCAYIYVPDDLRMREFIDRIMEEQEEEIRERAGRPEGAPGYGVPTFRPGRAELGPNTYADLFGRLSEEESERISLLVKNKPALAHWKPRDVLD